MTDAPELRTHSDRPDRFAFGSGASVEKSITPPTPATPKPPRARFIEGGGGAIIDSDTGVQVCRVTVENLTTRRARALAATICAALNEGAQA